MLTTVTADNVKQLSLFSGITEFDKNALLAGGRMRACPRGKMIFAQGDPVTRFFIVIKGTIQLFRTTPDGHEKTIEVVKEGQTLCESEVMDACRSHRTNAVPAEDSVIMEFPVSWLKEAAKTNGTFALNLLSSISAQAHLAEVEAEHQATMSAAQLVACFLQRLCVLYDCDPKGFELPYSKTLIASRLGMELETFSRTLNKLKDQGIAVTGTHVSIHDLKRIEEYVCGACSIANTCATHETMEKKACASTAKRPA